MTKILTKAETLKLILSNLKRYKIKNLEIPKFIFFSKAFFLKNKKKCILKIEKEFLKKKIIIRSSSLDEDTNNLSNAGKYLSIANLKAQHEVIKKSIEDVIDKFDSLKDQILIQEYIYKTNISGVLFTREANYNSPYYTINYDTSGKTDLVTSGKNDVTMETEYIFRDKINLSKKFNSLLKIVKKLEKILGSDRLDIEFALKNKKWILFQCRRLPGHNLKNKKNDTEISKVLVNLKKKIEKLKKNNPSIEGNTTYFSNMADWNPAEMIGTKPKMLAISLYAELITDYIWGKQRKNYKYKDVSPNVLMVNLAGSPFIDLRTDLNSFLPQGLNSTLEKKLVNHYLFQLKSKTYLHDKIEFEVVPTCFDLNMLEHKNNTLNEKEKNDYFIKIKKTTNFIINAKNNLINKEISKIKILEKKIDQIQKFKISEIQKIFFLVNHCKTYGTLPFSGIARIAFVCTKILRSLVDRGTINQKFVEEIYLSIPTITKKLNIDHLKANKSKKFKDLFLRKYGHLRPSTYSITSKNYKEAYDQYFSKIKKKEEKKLQRRQPIDKAILKKIDILFKKEKMNISAEEFIYLLKRSIQYREYSKFIFSKSINCIFENLVKFGKKLKINRKDLQHISIKKILNSYSVLETEKLASTLKRDIINNKKSFEILKQIKFPDFITSSEDVYCHKIKLSRGNYITNKNTSGDLIHLDNMNNLNKLNKKIVILENADPGFDFIFSYQIKGLITKYGGANSHMAIRCLELNIPAIIGIGEAGFDKISETSMIEFDCEKKTYKTIN